MYISLIKSVKCFNSPLMTTIKDLPTNISNDAAKHLILFIKEAKCKYTLS